MNQNPNQASHEETLTRFIDGELSTHDLSSTPEWLAEKAAAQQVGHLLRTHLHARQEPISPEFFTSQIMQQIAAENPSVLPQILAPSPSFWQKFSVWLAPLTATAAVLVVGGMMMKQRTVESAYTPIPNAAATLVFNDDAQATVINLTGLEAIPDTQEIKAYNVASNGSHEPGTPQQFYAANDPTKLVFVMFPGTDGAPSIHEMR